MPVGSSWGEVLVRFLCIEADRSFHRTHGRAPCLLNGIHSTKTTHLTLPRARPPRLPHTLDNSKGRTVVRTRVGTTVARQKRRTFAFPPRPAVPAQGGHGAHWACPRCSGKDVGVRARACHKPIPSPPAVFIALGEAARYFGALAAVLMAPPPGQPASGDAPDPPAQARAQSHGIADGSSDSDEPGGAPAPPKKKAKGGTCLHPPPRIRPPLLST